MKHNYMKCILGFVMIGAGVLHSSGNFNGAIVTKSDELIKEISLEPGESLRVKIGGLKSVLIKKEAKQWNVGISISAQKMLLLKSSESGENAWLMTHDINLGNSVFDTNLDGIPDWIDPPDDGKPNLLVGKFELAPIVEIDAEKRIWESNSVRYRYSREWRFYEKIK